VSEVILLSFTVLMVLDALPGAVKLGKWILRPKRRRGKAAPGVWREGADGLARHVPEDEEPATLWGRISKAKFEIIELLVDAVTVQSP
jgi:hypothetical protein